MDNGKKFVCNQYGIVVRVACFSCDNCTGHYKCMVRRTKVPRDFYCTDWKMRFSLNQAGKGDGVVKSKKELMENLGYVVWDKEEEKKSTFTIV